MRITATNTSGELYNSPTNTIIDLYQISYTININSIPDIPVFSSTVIDNNSVDPAIQYEPFAQINEFPIGKKIKSNSYLNSGATNQSTIVSNHYSKRFGIGYEILGIRNPTFAPSYSIRIYT